MDVSSIRCDFPVLRDWAYLDNAFVGLMPRQVRDGYREYVDQFVPNWNSITMPLATPRAKISPNIFTQKRVIL